MVNRTNPWVQRISVLVSLLAWACEGEEIPPQSPPLFDAAPSALSAARTDGEAGGAACPFALAVVGTDYLSGNVSVLSPSGAVLSESILSSASAKPGLSTALSADAVLPHSAPASGKIVVLDRKNAVVTWLDPSAGQVIGQLSVGTGFDSNPHDYVDLPGAKAYVTRYNTNHAPGAQAHDGGGDVLVLDTAEFGIRTSIPLASSTDGVFSPNPDRMLQVAEDVWVLLQRFDPDYATAGDARIVGISSADDSIAWTIDLPGAANCSGMARSPDGQRVALSCTGAFDGSVTNDRSAVVLLDATARPPVVTNVFPSATTLHPPARFGSSIAFVSQDRVIGTTLGDPKLQRNDIVFELSLKDATSSVLFDAGEAFMLGEVYCGVGCSSLCFATVASGAADILRVWKIGEDSLEEQPPIEIDPSLKLRLPPRWLSPVGG